jgi:hypothetical protein
MLRPLKYGFVILNLFLNKSSLGLGFVFGLGIPNRIPDKVGDTLVLGLGH